MTNIESENQFEVDLTEIKNPPGEFVEVVVTMKDENGKDVTVIFYKEDKQGTILVVGPPYPI